MDITAFLEGVYQATESTNHGTDVNIRAVSMTGLYKGMNFRLTVSQSVYRSLENEERRQALAVEADYYKGKKAY